ncbi:hypothetical protein Val02_62790 [Virgisporangium aliadipatigenens]|uniref:Uncharacterized protein n=1 Tax=Virgisporangium aliadipatigenens TaxID=741659 RepID=A0A8J4DTU6_9ACTN|nr:type IV secretion system DNA-binding domain-containing protein [Virgisporangium aliadipatigenens]GIJ49393.1 hypothetical protein Val02_62790 [Virgisporangium aliadipatigenens]
MNTLWIAIASAPTPPPSPPSPSTPARPEPIAPPSLDGSWAVTAALWVWDRPWLLTVVAAAAMCVLVGREVLASWRHRHHAAGARLVTIAPPPQVEPGAAQQLWGNLSGVLAGSRWRRLLYGVPHVVWQYTWTGRQLLIAVWVPGTVAAGALEAAIRGAWPGAATTTTPATPPIAYTPDSTAVGGHLVPAYAEWFPFADDFTADPLRALIAAGSQLNADERLCVQILTRPASRRRTLRARKAAARLRAGKTGVPTFNPAGLLLEFLSGPSRPTGTRAPAAGRDPQTVRDVRAIVDKTAQPLWQTAIRYIVVKTNGRRSGSAVGRVRNVADSVAASYAVYDGRNQLRHRPRMRHPQAVLDGRRLGAGFLTNTSELARFAALPQDLAVPGLDRARARSMPVPVAVPSGGRGHKVLGDAEIGGHAVALAVPDARYHTHMVGQTGSGKTTLLANLIIADIKAGRGTVVLDPHGDLVLDVLDRLPAEVADRIVLFDPDQPVPPTLNPLQGKDADLVVDNIVSIFGAIFAKAWGPRMDDVMRVSCLTLLRHPNATLQGIPALLTDRAFRARLVADLDDPDLNAFWVWYDSMSDGVRAQVIGPVLARLRAFLLRDFVRKTMRHPASSFDMGKILNGGVLLVRIPKGTLGEDTSRLLGSMILAQVWQAASARAAVPVERRRDCSIFLDECQNFLTLASSLDTMLAEARKYRLSMTLAHQDLAQFPRELVAAASANARNKVFFSVAPEDARVLARHTVPELDEHDLTHLDAYTAAARLVAGGRQSAAFTMRTRPPLPVLGHTAEIRQRVAERTEAFLAAAEADGFDPTAPNDADPAGPAENPKDDGRHNGASRRSRGSGDRLRRPKGTGP